MQSLTLRVTQGPFMFRCFLISPALHQCPLKCAAPKKAWGASVHHITGPQDEYPLSYACRAAKPVSAEAHYNI